jgi:hypothetical protein
LRDINPRKLQSSNLRVYNDDASDASSPTAYFVYDSTNTHFAEVMAYFHLDTFEEWMIDEMGMSSTQVDTIVRCNVHSTLHHAQTSKFLKIIYLGDEEIVDGLNPAYNDASVIAHEYMHIISAYHDDMTNGDEQKAMDEAFSDFFAVCYLNEYHTTSIFAEYIDNSATYTWYRDLDNNAHKDDFGDINRTGKPVVDRYDNSMIYSGALWDFRTDGDVNANDASALVYESLTALDEPDFTDGRDALVNEAIEWEEYTQGDDKWRDDVEAAFQAHGIGTLAPSVTISGSTGLFFRQSATWTSNVTNGKSPFTYQWYYKPDGSSTWTEVGTNSSSYSRTMGQVSFTLAVTVTDSDSFPRTCSDTHWVEYIELKKEVGELSEDTPIPSDFSLSQNYPNPFNPQTEIKFGLPKDSAVRLDIYNIKGQKIANIADEFLEAGYHSYPFYGVGLPSGIYFYKIVAGYFTDVKRMLLVK